MVMTILKVILMVITLAAINKSAEKGFNKFEFEDKSHLH